MTIQLPIRVQQENDCSPFLHQWTPCMQASRGEMTLMHKGNTKDIRSQAKSPQGRLDSQHQQRKTLWCQSNQPQEPLPSQEHPSRPHTPEHPIPTPTHKPEHHQRKCQDHNKSPAMDHFVCLSSNAGVWTLLIIKTVMKSYKTHNIYHNKNTVYKDMQNKQR